jgi:septal ring factor EnvC (AmiA/AmiB activator)
MKPLKTLAALATFAALAYAVAKLNSISKEIKRMSANQQDQKQQLDDVITQEEQAEASAKQRDAAIIQALEDLKAHPAAGPDLTAEIDRIKALVSDSATIGVESAASSSAPGEASS